MKRARDILLAVVLLGAAGVGAYEIGRLVDRYSKSTSAADSELNQTTTATTTTHHGRTIAGHHVTPLLVGSAVGAAILAILVVGLLNAFFKSRKRQHWRVSQ